MKANGFGSEMLVERTDVEQIDTQIVLIQRLKSQLTEQVLRNFVSAQPYGTYSDEYVSIKQLTDSDPLNNKLQKNCRLANYPSYVEETIPRYNANVHKGYIVCEGPDPDKHDSIEQFIAGVCMNKRHATVNTIIVSGMPYDHFSKPYQHLLNYADYIPHAVGQTLNVSGGHTILRKEPTENRSTAGIEHICLEISQILYGRVVIKQFEIFRFINNPDLQRAQITEEDMPLLLDIALRDPNTIALHCGAGLSRSVSKLLMFIIFNKLTNNISQFVKGESIDTEGFLNSVDDEFRRIRIHRPGAIGNKDLLIEAITLAVELREVQLKSIRDKLNFKNQENREVEETSHQLSYGSSLHA